MPSLSARFGNDKPYFEMNFWNCASVPVHATPMMSILPANFFASSSTEGASALQTSQVGAQNQNATFFPAYCFASKVPPPTSGAVKSRVGGTAADTAAATVVVAAAPLSAAAVTAGFAAAAVEAVLAAGASAPTFVVVAALPHAARAKPDTTRHAATRPRPLVARLGETNVMT